MKSALKNSYLLGAYQEWVSASNKTAVVGKWAECMQISVQTLYRHLKAFGAESLPVRKVRRDKGKLKIADLRLWAREVAFMIASVPKAAGRQPSVEMALEVLLENGLVPSEAGEVPVGTYHRVLRELKLVEQSKQCRRFESRIPNQVWQYDASGSEYLYVKKGKGEPLIGVRSTKSYKNKDKHEEYKIWYHGAVDDCSRCAMVMAFVAPGESSADALKFLKWAMTRKEDSRFVVRGVPQRLYMDNGVLSKAEAPKDLFRCLNVPMDTHLPDNARATGKVERSWRTFWGRFELGFVMQPNFAGKEYTIREINERVQNYLIKWNRKLHPSPRWRGQVKEDVWLKVMEHGGVVDVDGNAFDKASKKIGRTVKADGLIQLYNKEYIVKEVANQKVNVCQSIYDPELLVVMSLDGRERFEVKPFVRPEWNEYHSAKDQEWERVRRDTDEFKVRLDAVEDFTPLYSKAGEDEVLRLPPPVQEVKEVKDKFRFDLYSSLGDALEEFRKISGVSLSGAELEDVKKLILEHALSKEYVKELADKVFNLACLKEAQA